MVDNGNSKFFIIDLQCQLVFQAIWHSFKFLSLTCNIEHQAIKYYSICCCCCCFFHVCLGLTSTNRGISVFCPQKVAFKRSLLPWIFFSLTATTALVYYEIPFLDICLLAIPSLVQMPCAPGHGVLDGIIMEICIHIGLNKCFIYIKRTPLQK